MCFTTQIDGARRTIQHTHHTSIIHNKSSSQESRAGCPTARRLKRRGTRPRQPSRDHALPKDSMDARPQDQDQGQGTGRPRGHSRVTLGAWSLGLGGAPGNSPSRAFYDGCFTAPVFMEPFPYASDVVIARTAGPQGGAPHCSLSALSVVCALYTSGLSITTDRPPPHILWQK